MEFFNSLLFFLPWRIRWFSMAIRETTFHRLLHKPHTCVGMLLPKPPCESWLTDFNLTYLWKILCFNTICSYLAINQNAPLDFLCQL
jgi:hypothetical protein